MFDLVHLVLIVKLQNSHIVSSFLTLLHVRDTGLTVFTITATVHILHILVLQQGARTYLQPHDRERGGREGGREATAPRHSPMTLPISPPLPLRPPWSVPPVSAFAKSSTPPFSYLGSPIVAERDAAGGCARN